MNKPRLSGDETKAQAFLSTFNRFAVEKEYVSHDDDLFNDDDTRVAILKRILSNSLTPSDRKIIVLYAELQSVRDLALILHISPSLAGREVRRVRSIILDEYRKAC